MEFLFFVAYLNRKSKTFRKRFQYVKRWWLKHILSKVISQRVDFRYLQPVIANDATMRYKHLLRFTVSDFVNNATSC